MVSRRRWRPLTSAVHWPPLKTRWDVPLLSLEPQPPWSPISLPDLPHPHTLKLWGLFNPKCEGQVPHLLPRGHGVMGKPGLHSIPHPWWAVVLLKASATLGPGPPFPHDTRGTGALSSGRNTPCLDPRLTSAAEQGEKGCERSPATKRGHLGWRPQAHREELRTA